MRRRNQDGTDRNNRADKTPRQRVQFAMHCGEPLVHLGAYLSKLLMHLTSQATDLLMKFSADGANFSGQILFGRKRRQHRLDCRDTCWQPHLVVSGFGICVANFQSCET